MQFSDHSFVPASRIISAEASMPLILKPWPSSSRKNRPPLPQPTSSALPRFLQYRMARLICAMPYAESLWFSCHHPAMRSYFCPMSTMIPVRNQPLASKRFLPPGSEYFCDLIFEVVSISNPFSCDIMHFWLGGLSARDSYGFPEPQNTSALIILYTLSRAANLLP